MDNRRMESGSSMTPAPQKGGEKQRANNSTTGKGKGQPDDDMTTLKRSLLADIGGGIFLWACMVESHNFVALWLYFAGLFIAHGLAALAANKIFKAFWFPFVTFMVLTILSAVVVYENSRPLADKAATRSEEH